MEINYNDLLSELKTGIITLAQSTVSNYKDIAIADANSFVSEIGGKLKRWTELLATKQLSTAEFEWLVASQKEYLKMTGLKLAGLAEVRAAQFAESVLNLVADVTLKVVTKAVGGLL